MNTAKIVNFPNSEKTSSDLLYENLNVYNSDVVEKLDEIAKTLENMSNQSKLVYNNFNSENNLSSEVKTILNEINKYVNYLEQDFDDIFERLNNLLTIKGHLKTLKCYINKNTNKYYYRACIILHDSIIHIKSEHLTLQQFHALKYTLQLLKNFNLDKDIFNEIDDILVENGLDWIPECD